MAPAHRPQDSVTFVLLLSAFAAVWLHVVLPQARTPETILVFGDSLSSGSGMRSEQGWVALLGVRLSQERWPFSVVNRSTPNTTVASGVERLPAVLSVVRPAILILQLGGIDGLTGQPLDLISGDLARMIRTAQQQHVAVLLVGACSAAGISREESEAFAAMYERLAASHHVPVVRCLTEGVPSFLMQLDGIHPSAAAQMAMLENVWDSLRPLLQAQKR